MKAKKAEQKKGEKKKSSSDRKILTVSDLNSQVRQQLETAFPRFWLKGELSNFTAHGSGHWYFSLKDNNSQISGVMFRGQNGRVKFKPKSGQEVIIFGRLSVYEPRGNYQVYVEHMEPVGAGALQQAFEELKQKLSDEGLFAQEHKKPLPEHPRHIAIVTSPTGAAIRDILNVLKRRYRAATVTVVPTVVQGEAAAPHVVKAIELAQQISDVDVMIVGRGGGSMEDLWCFNDEAVARAIFNSKVPVISAVGHEIDFTISDFVADLRAPTPSAAAELVAANSDELIDRLEGLKKYLGQAMQGILSEARHEFLSLRQRLVDPRKALLDFSQRADELLMRLERAAKNGIRERQLKIQGLRQGLVHPHRLLQSAQTQVSQVYKRMAYLMRELIKTKNNALEKQMSLMDSLSPLRVLDRGYALVKHQGQVLKVAKNVQPGDEIEIRLAEGELEATVKHIK
ncbi:MAG: exodeoxyribonuclease VII large subunit [Bdellovibrionales bacterium]